MIRFEDWCEGNESVESEQSPDDLDDDTWIAMEQWLSNVLPAFARESEPKIREDILSLLLEAQDTNANLSDILPDPDRFARKPQSKYLRFDDVVWLESFNGGRRPALFRSDVNRDIALVSNPRRNVGLGGIFDSYADAGPFFPAAIVVYVLESLLRARVKNYLGPLGCAFLCDIAIWGYMLLVIGMGGFAFLIMVNILEGGVAAFSGLDFFLAGILTWVTLFGAVYALVGYLAMRAKIRNNYDLVAEILEIPGYTDENEAD